MDVRFHVVDRSRNTFAFFACRLNKDFDFLEILFSKFARMLHFRRDTRTFARLRHATRSFSPSSRTYSRDLAPQRPSANIVSREHDSTS